MSARSEEVQYAEPVLAEGQNPWEVYHLESNDLTVLGVAATINSSRGPATQGSIHASTVIKKIRSIYCHPNLEVVPDQRFVVSKATQRNVAKGL